MSYVLFYLESGQPKAERFGADELTAVLSRSHALSNDKTGTITYVCTSSAPADMVGRNGVAAVENGKTPDGNVYDWSKAHRGAGPTRSVDLSTKPDETT